MKGPIFTILLFTIGLFFALSCSRPVVTPIGIPSLTLSENTNRATLGLRLVGTNWFHYSSEFGEEKWKIDPKGYLAKTICRDAENKIQWEQDYYYTGRKYIVTTGDPGMIDWEFLAISYSYTNKVLDVEYVGDDPAVPALLSQITPTSTDKEKFSVADEILKRWGMSRQ